MKKNVLIVCLLLASVCAMAQKKYLILTTTSSNLYLGGDIPNDMEKSYYFGNSSYINRNKCIADVLSQLSEHGFVVEQMISGEYLLSKGNSGNYNAITRVASDGGEEAYEVARYNLQGVPVSKNEKGVQIIVYSNYTTKTVIVE